MKAKWIMDYDHVTDDIYKRPGCADCQAPVGMDGKCFSCGKKYKLTDDMKAWMDEMSGEKVEIGECIKCGGVMEMHLIRNPVSGTWQVGYGHCDKCGMKFIV